jgi:hypothetical protein
MFNKVGLSTTQITLNSVIHPNLTELFKLLGKLHLHPEVQAILQP